MMAHLPRPPVDLQAVTKDVKAKVRRVIGELEAIEQQSDPIAEAMFSISAGPNWSDVRLILKIAHPSSPHFWRFNEMRSSVSASRPGASTSISWPPASAA
jgi:hypothetical protein